MSLPWGDILGFVPKGGGAGQRPGECLHKEGQPYLYLSVGASIRLPWGDILGLSLRGGGTETWRMPPQGSCVGSIYIYQKQALFLSNPNQWGFIQVFLFFPGKALKRHFCV